MPQKFLRDKRWLTAEQLKEWEKPKKKPTKKDNKEVVVPQKEDDKK